MFNIEGEAIHRLNQEEEGKQYIIKAENTLYKLSKMQVSLLFPDALNHFTDSSEPYFLDLPSESDSFIQYSMKEFAYSFELLFSLFTTQAEITLTEENCQVFKFLSKVLDNPQLLARCQEITSKNSQVFKISSKSISSIPKKAKSFFNDFELKVNRKIYEINFSLFCCVSDKFVQMGKERD
jgi:hypothetical protein